jgi:carbamoyl-phosphate synthase large subunit
MKSVGEVMAIGRTFEESLQKAIRQIDPRYKGFEAYAAPEDLDRALSRPTDMRLFVIAYAMYHKNYSVDKIPRVDQDRQGVSMSESSLPII